MPIDDEIPSGKPFYVYWIINGGAEQQSGWLSENFAYVHFREKVRYFLGKGPKDSIHYEVGIYNAEIEKTITRLIHMPS